MLFLVPNNNKLTQDQNYCKIMKIIFRIFNFAIFFKIFFISENKYHQSVYMLNKNFCFCFWQNAFYYNCEYIILSVFTI